MASLESCPNKTKNKAAELQRIDATGIFANFGYGGGLGGLPKHGRAKKRTIVERSPSKEKKENEAILPAAKRKSTGLFGSPQAKTLPTPTNESPVTVDSMDDEIHAAIQTPARHLRPRTFVPDGEFSPPIEAIPTVTKAPASILKKPRTEASPSRGHIRFVGLPKLSDSPESPVAVDPKAPAPRFAMDLTDESDEEMEFDGQVSRSDFLKKPVEQKEPEQVDVEDECIEMEKTFEKAEDTGFEVAEDVTPEDVTPEEAAQEDVTPEKSSPEDVTPDLTTPEVVTNEEAASEDVTPEEVAPEDVTPEGEASEDVTPEEVALEAVKEVLALNEPEEANEELEKSMEVQSDADEPVFVIITEEGEDEILDVKVEREEGLEKSTEVQAEEPGKEEEEGPLNATFTIERAETPVVEPEELMYGVSFDDDGVERSFEIQADEKKDLESGPIGSMFVREKSPEAQIEVEVEEKKAKTPSRSSSRLSTRSRQASEEPVEKPTPKARRSTRAASKVATPAAPASSTTTISPSRQRGTPRTRLFSEQTVQVVDDSAASAKRKTRSQSVTANTADEATAPKRGRYDWRSKLEKGLKELEESRKMEKPAEEAEVQAPGSTTKRGTRSRTTSNSSTADVQTPSKRTRATTKAAMETLVEVEDSEPTSTRRTARSRTTSTSSTVPTSPKRGRPPKNTEAKETPSSAAKKTPRSRTNSVSSTTTNAETPSKRGRPPKVALETVEEDVEAMTTTASAKRAPRSRTASTSSTVNPVPETPNTQKRRGRPPKATLEPITDNSPPASTTRRTRRTPSRTTD
ncbi:unnamed protein product [Caenorhabditis auriculariae]|uniref:Uncharacterized protein n=1 Tax=Caenorhabditis auriculariae TaxID=2777116 RepID=A0A8S1HRG0_9PELO|nr:unnamed protein product [Caenorhabditis auriculariae]